MQLNHTHLGSEATFLLRLTDVVFVLRAEAQQNHIPGKRQEIPTPSCKNSPSLSPNMKVTDTSTYSCAEVLNYFCAIFTYSQCIDKSSKLLLKKNKPKDDFLWLDPGQ